MSVGHPDWVPQSALPVSVIDTFNVTVPSSGSVTAFDLDTTGYSAVDVRVQTGSSNRLFGSFDYLDAAGTPIAGGVKFLDSADIATYFASIPVRTTRLRGFLTALSTGQSVIVRTIRRSTSWTGWSVRAPVRMDSGFVFLNAGQNLFRRQIVDAGTVDVSVFVQGTTAGVFWEFQDLDGNPWARGSFHASAAPQVVSVPVWAGGFDLAIRNPSTTGFSVGFTVVQH